MMKLVTLLIVIHITLASFGLRPKPIGRLSRRHLLVEPCQRHRLGQ